MLFPVGSAEQLVIRNVDLALIGPIACQHEVTDVRSRLNHIARGDIQLVLGRAGDWRVDPFDNLASGWTDDHAGELRKFGVQISVVAVDVEVSLKGDRKSTRLNYSH